MTGPRSLRFAGDRWLEACFSGALAPQRGRTGPGVAKLQQALMDLGYSLRDFGPDGVLGRETEAALAAFTAGSRTLAALDDHFADEPAGTLPRRTAPSQRASVSGEHARIAALMALDQVGAHFLDGATGGDVTLAPGCTDPVMPAVFAAQAGPHVCCGRFNARNGGIAGGRPATPTDTDLIVYLARLAALPEAEWKPFFGFFSPRQGDGAGFGRRLVWGEDCRGKRHFDGAGLVNWCLREAAGAGQAIDVDMAGWATDASGTESVPLTEPPRTGDLVLRALDGRFTHIGFLVAGDEQANVVLAEQPSVGVVVRRFSPSGWTVRRRSA